MPDPKNWLPPAVTLPHTGGHSHGPGKPLWEGSGQPLPGPLGRFQRAGIHSSVRGQIQLDNLLRDGFLCSITTKIHQTELRGFNAGNCGVNAL